MTPSQGSVAPMLTVELEPERRAIHVHQALGQGRVIMFAYQPTHFMTPAEAEALAAALVEAAEWQREHGPLPRRGGARAGNRDRAVPKPAGS